MHRLAARTALALSVVLMAVPAAASADCDAQALTKPFAPWLDFADYTMPDGASFEHGVAGWVLDDGATVVADNEPFRVHAADDSSALRLPHGSSAISAPICIGLGHPTLRLFARSNTTLTLSTLRVDVRFRDLAGKQRSLPVGVVLPDSRWQPTLPMPVVVNLLTLVTGSTDVTLGFTPVGSANWWIDDVYVDPKARD